MFLRTGFSGALFFLMENLLKMELRMSGKELTWNFLKGADLCVVLWGELEDV